MNNLSLSGHNKYFKILGIASFILLILCLTPMVVLGFYAHPLGDDFYYGVPGAEALREYGTVFSIFPAAVRGTIEQYMIWQGTYSAMFLMHLPPQLFGSFFYRLYPALVILLLTGSIFFVVKTLVISKEEDKNNTFIWLSISSLLSILCIEFVPVCAETFYWFNGSVYYTGFLAATLFMLGLILRFRRLPGKLSAVFSVLLSLFIAGGNYASLLPTILLIAFILLLDIFNNPFAGFTLNKKRKLLTLDILVITMLTAGFLISILAPGNALRAATSYGTTPLKAILKSILQCIGYAKGWTTPAFYAVLTLLTPLFVYLIKKSSFSFKYPLIICPLAFLIFCSCETPTFYAQNNGGAARVFDICYYMMLFVLMFIYYYILGWIVRFLEKKKKQTTGKLYIFCGAALCIICIGVSLLRSAGETFFVPNSVTAAISLANGEADYYDEQYLERYRIINEAGQGSDVIVPRINVPERLKAFINCGDLSPYSEDNSYVAAYYGLNSIKTDE